MPRTLMVTLEVVLDHLPAEEIDDLAEYAEEHDLTLEEATTETLRTASAREVAECIEQGSYDPEIFAGSMLYLKVNEARVVTASWKD